MTEQALTGVKVIDLTHYIAGPYCTRLLTGFGADVIKIEKPNAGDPSRSIGPFLHDEPGIERSGLFLYLNINKKGITLNLKSNAGIKILKELVKDADVLIESFSQI
ncbi:MAG: CoA transferase [Dehalococcoidales bacterium]|nr:CoA transferase [Dehalococcoidales bacterium]